MLESHSNHFNFSTPPGVHRVPVFHWVTYAKKTATYKGRRFLADIDRVNATEYRYCRGCVAPPD